MSIKSARYFDVIQFYLKALQYRGSRPVETKLDYAIDKTILILKRAITDNGCEKNYAEIEGNNAIKFAEVDKATKVLLKDAKGGYCYTSKSANELRSANLEAQLERDNTLLTFTPYFASEIPDNLTVEYMEFFKGYVIKEDFEIIKYKQFESEQL